jgi:hypothetical protein
MCYKPRNCYGFRLFAMANARTHPALLATRLASAFTRLFDAHKRLHWGKRKLKSRSTLVADFSKRTHCGKGGGIHLPLTVRPIDIG